MKQVFSLQQHLPAYAYHLLLFAMIVLYMPSCRTTPEDTGKKLSDKACECDKISTEDDHEKTLDYNRKLLSALKIGNITTYQQLSIKEDEIRKSVYGDGENRDLKECREELKKMAQEAQLKFAKEDDRKTIENAYEANQGICREERKTGNEEFRKESDGLEKEIEQLKQKLVQ